MPSRHGLRHGCLFAAALTVFAVAGRADPILPVIGAADYNVLDSNASVDGGAVAVTGTNSANAAANTTVINDFIQYASANGGGTVEIPAGTYLSNEILMANGVNLQVDTGATLQNNQPASTFIGEVSGANSNIEISGGGIINSNATATSGNKMIQLVGITNLEVTGVSIENAPQEHLVTEDDANVTINGVTIHDATTIANTDGIDFSGTNFLIENCNLSDGDDDIVAKPDTSHKNGITAYTANVVINNCTLTAGHGISIGGETNVGLNGMYVSNIIENGPLLDGIHLKAGDGTTTSTEGAGLVQNVTFNNITMTGVQVGIGLDSFYNNGSSNFPPTPSDATPFPVAPTDATEPLWQNITFENITINGATSNFAQIYGLNSSPANLDGLNFMNVTGTASHPFDMYYASDVYMNGVMVNGSAIPNQLANVVDGSSVQQSQEYADEFDGAPLGTVFVPAVPEPSCLGMLAAAGVLGLRRRRAHAFPH